MKAKLWEIEIGDGYAKKIVLARNIQSALKKAEEYQASLAKKDGGTIPEITRVEFEMGED